MNDSAPHPNDPAVLADEVRALATDAYRSLTGQAVVPSAARDLSQRASLLKSRIDGLAADDLSLWLDNLRRRIDPPDTSPPIAVGAMRAADDSPGEPNGP